MNNNINKRNILSSLNSQAASFNANQSSNLSISKEQSLKNKFNLIVESQEDMKDKMSSLLEYRTKLYNNLYGTAIAKYYLDVIKDAYENEFLIKDNLVPVDFYDHMTAAYSYCKELDKNDYIDKYLLSSLNDEIEYFQAKQEVLKSVLNVNNMSIEENSSRYGFSTEEYSYVDAGIYYLYYYSPSSFIQSAELYTNDSNRSVFHFNPDKIHVQDDKKYLLVGNGTEELPYIDTCKEDLINRNHRYDILYNSLDIECENTQFKIDKTLDGNGMTILLRNCPKLIITGEVSNVNIILTNVDGTVKTKFDDIILENISNNDLDIIEISGNGNIENVNFEYNFGKAYDISGEFTDYVYPTVNIPEGIITAGDYSVTITTNEYGVVGPDPKLDFYKNTTIKALTTKTDFSNLPEIDSSEEFAGESYSKKFDNESYTFSMEFKNSISSGIYTINYYISETATESTKSEILSSVFYIDAKYRKHSIVYFMMKLLEINPSSKTLKEKTKEFIEYFDSVNFTKDNVIYQIEDETSAFKTVKNNYLEALVDLFEIRKEEESSYNDDYYSEFLDDINNFKEMILEDDTENCTEYLEYISEYINSTLLECLECSKTLFDFIEGCKESFLDLFSSALNQNAKDLLAMIQSFPDSFDNLTVSSFISLPVYIKNKSVDEDISIYLYLINDIGKEFVSKDYFVPYTNYVYFKKFGSSIIAKDFNKTLEELLEELEKYHLTINSGAIYEQIPASILTLSSEATNINSINILPVLISNTDRTAAIKKYIQLNGIHYITSNNITPISIVDTILSLKDNNFRSILFADCILEIYNTTETTEKLTTLKNLIDIYIYLWNIENNSTYDLTTM